MNIRVITASAGTGKTFRLTCELDDAIGAGRARPEGIVAMTFTTQAAAELVERARTRLLQSGRTREAHQLLAARIGTVNAVCGSLLVDHAFELGLSPAMRVLDEVAADAEFRRALVRVVTEERAAELDSFKARFDPERDWRHDVRQLVEAARANGLSSTDLPGCAARSLHDLDACLGPVTSDDLDGALAITVAGALAAIDVETDRTARTADYVVRLQRSALDLASARGLAWGGWAHLAKQLPAKKSLAHAAPVQHVASRHAAHPRLRAELHRLINLEFEIAADALAAYQAHKRTHAVIDFVDQESLALDLLRRPEIREALAGQIDLFLVDEFQDTSPIQLALFLELATLATETIWVGDPKQAIYGFRGTDPSLMDDAIEALTSPTSDADLVEQAANTIGRGRLDTLRTSYRSRAALVGVTSEIFARAFASQGMPEERTRIVAASTAEPASLGEVLEYWPLDLDRGDGTDNECGRAAAVATKVRDLLAARDRSVRDSDAVRPARPRDVAVLCRTNKQCQAIADALGALAVPAVVPRMHLLDTMEAQVVLHGLALWIDPDDAVAAASLARTISYPTNLEALVARALAAPGRDAFRDDPAVASILAARDTGRDLGPVAAIDAILTATRLRELCAGWGNTAQRVANLDALRSHAASYVRISGQSGDAPTLVGLLRRFEVLAPSTTHWASVRTDRQALLAGEDAVTVSTWHRAKGLEWPITILFGLETMRAPTTFGVHVLTDRTSFDIADPLGGRWIRCWPSPYPSAQHGPVRTAIEHSPAHAILVDKAHREALRVLYVGWTRARDRLVLAARRGKLLDGIAGRLSAIDPRLIHEPSADLPAGTHTVQWAGVEIPLRIAPCRPAPSVAVPREPGTFTIGRLPSPGVPARLRPSEAAPVACTIGESIRLGPRISLVGAPDLEAVGDALHAFFAADRLALDAADRLALAIDLLAAHGLADHLAPADVVDMATRLWTWIDTRFPGYCVHREWPIGHRLDTGALLSGTADLVITDGTSFVVIDHKSFPGRTEAAQQHARDHSGQLAAYAAAIRAATGSAVVPTWIHFPIRGYLVEVRLADPGS